MQEQETAVGEVDALGQDEVLSGLGDGHDLGTPGGSSRRGDGVAPLRVAVYGVDAPLSPDELGEGHRHVTGSRPDVDAAPAGLESEALEGGGEGTPVDVVAQPEFGHRDDGNRLQ